MAVEPQTLIVKPQTLIVKPQTLVPEAQTLASEPNEGAGVGLALMYEMLQLQGTTINMSSTLSERTCFTIAHHLVELHHGTICAQSAGEGRGATLYCEASLTLNSRMLPKTINLKFLCQKSYVFRSVSKN